jgi:hypothetical protein
LVLWTLYHVSSTGSELVCLALSSTWSPSCMDCICIMASSCPGGESKLISIRESEFDTGGRDYASRYIPSGLHMLYLVIVHM